MNGRILSLCLTSLFIAAVARSQTPAAKPAPADSPRAAVERSLPLLQGASVSFIKSAGCVSCHHNTLTVMTLAMARSQNVRVDEDLAFAQQELTEHYLARWRDAASTAADAPKDAGTLANLLLALSVDGHPSDVATDAMAAQLSQLQTETGQWHIAARRFADDSEDMVLTATAIRALRVYAPKADRAAYDPRIVRAAAWLSKAAPETTEGRAFQLLGLDWSRAPEARSFQAARELLRTQQADGGWSQTPAGASDAYATGEALFALVETQTLDPSDPVWERGAKFLQNSQFADGSWFVKSRATMLQPHADSGFPFGRDQFSSIAATNWAAMALALGVR